MEKGKERLLFVDIAKGICILLVVLGHAISKERAMHQYIYSVHIPTFILLSGFFEKKQENYLPYLRKTFSRLYFPFLFFVLLDFLVIMFQYHTSFLYYLIHSFLGATGFECVYNVPTWFLLDLFIVKAVFQLFHRIDNAKLMKMVLVAIIILGVSYMTLSDYYDFIYRYWPINSLIPVLTYYCIGFLVRNTIKMISQTFNGDNTKDKVFLSVIMLMCFVILIPTSQLNGVVSFFGNKFNNAFAFLFNSMIGAFAVIILSCLLATTKLPVIKRLNFFGKHSLFIQVTHYYPLTFGFYPIFENIGLFDRFPRHSIEFLIFVLTVIISTLLIFIKEAFLKLLEKNKNCSPGCNIRVC